MAGRRWVGGRVYKWLGDSGWVGDGGWGMRDGGWDMGDRGWEPGFGLGVGVGIGLWCALVGGVNGEGGGWMGVIRWP